LHKETLELGPVVARQVDPLQRLHPLFQASLKPLQGCKTWTGVSGDSIHIAVNECFWTVNTYDVTRSSVSSSRRKLPAQWRFLM